MFSSPHRRPTEIFSVIFKCYVIICFEELKPPPVYVWNVLHYWTQMVWNHLFYWVIFRCTCQGSGPVYFYILIPSLVKNNNLLLEKPFATDYFSPVSRLITRTSDLTQWRNRQEGKTLKNISRECKSRSREDIALTLEFFSWSYYPNTVNHFRKEY